MNDNIKDLIISSRLDDYICGYWKYKMLIVKDVDSATKKYIAAMDIKMYLDLLIEDWKQYDCSIKNENLTNNIIVNSIDKYYELIKASNPSLEGLNDIYSNIISEITLEKLLSEEYADMLSNNYSYIEKWTTNNINNYDEENIDLKYVFAVNCYGSYKSILDNNVDLTEIYEKEENFSALVYKAPVNWLDRIYC